MIDDLALLEPLTSHGRTPELGIRVDVEEAFFHCARAFLRSQLWEPEAWPERPIPSLGRVLADQTAGRYDAGVIDDDLAEDAHDLG